MYIVTVRIAHEKPEKIHEFKMQVLFCGVRCCYSVTYVTIACRQVSRPAVDEFEGRLCQTISFYQSTYIYRASHMSPRRNWDSPNPSAASECALPPTPGQKGAGHTRLPL
jgi:hypothetical protein